MECHQASKKELLVEQVEQAHLPLVSQAQWDKWYAVIEPVESLPGFDVSRQMHTPASHQVISNVSHALTALDDFNLIRAASASSRMGMTHDLPSI